MSSILSSVCLTDELADVYFRFPNDNITRIPAHKTILSLRSPVFKAMFYGTFPRKDKDVVIEDVTAPIFESFMRYFNSMSFQSYFSYALTYITAR